MRHISTGVFWREDSSSYPLVKIPLLKCVALLGFQWLALNCVVYVAELFSVRCSDKLSDAFNQIIRNPGKWRRSQLFFFTRIMQALSLVRIQALSFVSIYLRQFTWMANYYCLTFRFFFWIFLSVHTEKSFLNLVNPNQIWIVITIFR